MGDLSAGVTNAFGALLEDYCVKWWIPIMHCSPRTHFHTLVMHIPQLLG